uniref:Glucose-6-phosphate translocase-like n=1 Tax=Phallusia mammillata TaxID=59560 RepID=A0A6F9DS28_9ASCI|nr:glucose-6-phosphate translocase-like [Phallusia mammillata]
MEKFRLTFFANSTKRTITFILVSSTRLEAKGRPYYSGTMLGLTSPYQWTFLICMYTGYMMYIFNRRSFSFVIPTVVKNEGMTMSEIGQIVSSIAMAYSIGKFVCGMLADKLSPRLMFASGLFITGIVNVAFSISEPKYFTLLAFANGLMQGPGWPACAKIVRRWYSPKIFGSMWSLLSTSMNVPASIGPLLCAYVLDRNGGNWRMIMSLCGTVSCGFAAVAFFVLRDHPEDIGLTLAKITGDESLNEAKPEKETKETNKKAKQMTIKRIFSSFYTYVLCVGFLMSLFLKGVVDNWSSLYLIQNKGSNQLLSSSFMGMVEIGGLIGSILSGIISDRLVAVNGFTPKGQPRHNWLIACHVVLLGSFLSFSNFITDAEAQKMVLSISGFCIGFSMYSIINLVGVLAIENSAADISGSSHAYCALMGNIGIMLAGLPFSVMQQSLSWNGSFQVCQLSIVISLFLFVISQFTNCRIGDLIKED